MSRWAVCGALALAACAGDGDDAMRGLPGDGMPGSGDGQAGSGDGFENSMNPPSMTGEPMRDPDDCGVDVYTGEPIPVDLLILLDRSSSMAPSSGKGGVRPDIWGAVTDALRDFVNTPGLDDIGGVGLTFFPVIASMPPPALCFSHEECGPYGPCCANLIECAPFNPLPASGMGTCASFFGPYGPGAPPDSCDPPDYAMPAVPIAPLATSKAPIESALDATKPEGATTPTDAAMAGAYMYLKERQMGEGAGRKPVLLLATDGRPEGCVDETIEDVAAKAADALTVDGVQTFAIGLDNVEGLDQVAVAGGSEKAIMAGASTEEFLAALDTVRGAVGCHYNLPTPEPGSVVDPDKVNLKFIDAAAAETKFPRALTEPECAAHTAWFYDDNANPGTITLCPAACDLIRATEGRVEVLAGCKQELI